MRHAQCSTLTPTASPSGMLCRVMAKTSSSMRRQLPDLAAASSRLLSSADAASGLDALSLFFACAASAALVEASIIPIICAPCASTVLGSDADAASFGIHGVSARLMQAKLHTHVVADNKEHSPCCKSDRGREPRVRNFFADTV
jgi:hypothetical protein